MILSRPSKFFLFVACVALADARAADVDLEKAVGSLIAAEKAYAKLAGEKGFRDASISVFADDAVIFPPNAVNGKKFWRETKEDPAITWRPIFASISRSGELGYTTGPSEYRKSRHAEEADAFGHFITIWRKAPNGVWKVALDVGVDHLPPQDAKTEIRTYFPNSPLLQPESASADLDKVQTEFVESLKEDEADAIIDHAGDDIRVYRRGQLPAVGKAAVKKMLSEEDAKRRAHRSARARVIPLISLTNTANTRVSAKTPRSAASTFASGDSNPMANGKYLSICRRARC
jgi:ketosteroid isomerase-like protein